MSATFDNILGRPKRTKRPDVIPEPNPMAAPLRSTLNLGNEVAPPDEQQQAGVLTADQIAQRGGTDNGIKLPSGAVSVAPNGAPTDTKIVDKTAVAKPQAAAVVNPMEEYVKTGRGVPQEGGRPDVLGADKGDEAQLREQAGVPQEQNTTTQTTGDSQEEEQGKTTNGMPQNLEELMLQMLQNYHVKTPEEIEAQQKREKRERMFASISDGLAAMHEAYSKARGVEPFAKGGAYDKVFARQKALKEMENREYKDYLSNYLNLMTQKRLAEKDKETAEYRRGILEMKSQDTERRLRKLDAEIDRLIAQGKTEEARQKQIEAQTTYTLAKSEGQNISNTYAPAYWEAKIGQANRSNTKSSSSGKSGGSSSGSGKSSKQKQPTVKEKKDRRGRVIERVKTSYDANGRKIVKTYDRYNRLKSEVVSGKAE